MKAPTIIAELSCNHLGDMTRALELVDAAAAAGADGIKIQVWEPERMVLDHTHRLEDGPWRGRNLKALYADAFTPWHWIPAILDRAKRHLMQAVASVFDTDALAYCQDLGVRVYKIASFELVDTPLIEAVARTGKPLILSTGMATGKEIAEAVEAARAGGCADLELLHCVSAYPAQPCTMGLHRIPEMREEFGCPVGLSDHTLGTAVAVAAVALGASTIEKHFTLNRGDGGPDARFSIEPHELKRLVADCTTAHEATQRPEALACLTDEEPQRKLRRSLYWAQDLEPDTIIIHEHMVTARPALGLPPRDVPAIVGRMLWTPVKRGQPVTGLEWVSPAEKLAREAIGWPGNSAPGT